MFHGIVGGITLTLEGFVENGRVRLRDTVTLPEHTRVHVVIPDVDAAPIVRLHSPRLRNPIQARDFAKQVISVISIQRDNPIDYAQWLSPLGLSGGANDIHGKTEKPTALGQGQEQEGVEAL